MANYSSANLIVCSIGGFDVRPSMLATDALSRSIKLEDVTPFGVSDQVQASTGLRMAKFGHEGLYDDAALASNAALAANFGSTVSGIINDAGNVSGGACTMLKGMIEGAWDRILKVGALTRGKAQYTITGEVDEGVLIVPQQTVTTSSASTVLDGGAGNAPSANGLVGVLQLQALTLDTATNFLVKFQDSADNSTFADVTSGAFTAVAASITTTPNSQRIITSGNVRRYVKVIWTWTGGAGAGSTATFVVGFRRALATDSAPTPPQ